MIDLLVVVVIVNLFCWGLVNDTFLNFKLIVFILTGFICNNKDVKQVVLINYGSKSPTLKRG